MRITVSEKHATVQKHQPTLELDPDVIYNVANVSCICLSDHQKMKVFHLFPENGKITTINYFSLLSDRVPYKSGTVVVLTQTESP